MESNDIFVVRMDVSEATVEIGNDMDYSPCRTVAEEQMSSSGSFVIDEEVTENSSMAVNSMIHSNESEHGENILEGDVDDDRDAIDVFNGKNIIKQEPLDVPMNELRDDNFFNDTNDIVWDEDIIKEELIVANGKIIKDEELTGLADFSEEMPSSVPNDHDINTCEIAVAAVPNGKEKIFYIFEMAEAALTSSNEESRRTFKMVAAAVPKGTKKFTNARGMAELAVSNGNGKITNTCEMAAPATPNSNQKIINACEVADGALPNGAKKITNTCIMAAAILPNNNEEISSACEIAVAAVPKNSENISNAGEIAVAAVQNGNTKISNTCKMAVAAVPNVKKKMTNACEIAVVSIQNGNVEISNACEVAVAAVPIGNGSQKVSNTCKMTADAVPIGKEKITNTCEVAAVPSCIKKVSHTGETDLIGTEKITNTCEMVVAAAPSNIEKITSACEMAVATAPNGSKKITNACEVAVAAVPTGNEKTSNTCDVPVAAVPNGNEKTSNTCDVPVAAVPNGNEKTSNTCDVPVAAVPNGNEKTSNTCDVPVAAVPNGNEKTSNTCDVPVAAVPICKEKDITNTCEMAAVSNYYSEKIASTCEIAVAVGNEEITEYVYLAKYKTYSKRIQVKNKTKEEVEQALKKVFADVFPPFGVIRIQQWCDEFDDYEDLDDFRTLPDKAKIQVFIDPVIRHRALQSSLSLDVPLCVASPPPVPVSVVMNSSPTPFRPRGEDLDRYRYEPTPMMNSLPTPRTRADDLDRSEPNPMINSLRTSSRTSAEDIDCYESISIINSPPTLDRYEPTPTTNSLPTPKTRAQDLDRYEPTPMINSLPTPRTRADDLDRYEHNPLINSLPTSSGTSAEDIDRYESIPMMNNSPPTLDRYEPTLMINSLPTPLRTSSEDLERYEPFPMNYVLPAFPPRVTSILRTNPAAVMAPEGRPYRRSIIQALFEQCERYERRYLKGHHYDVICKTLVRKYPALADKAASRNNNKKGSWRKKLIDKFKGERQKMNSGDIQEMREKYGHRKGKKRRAPETSPSLPADIAEGSSEPLATSDETGEICERKKKRPEVRLPVIGIRDTAGRVERHLSSINREWGRKKPCDEIIDDRMDRTAEYRLGLYRSGVQVLLNKYPLLRNCRQLIKDGERFFDVNLTAKRKEWFTKTKLEFLLQQCLRKLPAGEYRLANVRSKRGQQETAVMAYAPLLFKEERENWIRFMTSLQRSTTGITAMTPLGSTSIQEASGYQVYLDGISVCGECPSLPLAVDAFIAVLLLFNVEHPKQLDNTCRFLTEVIYGLPGETKLPMIVQRLVNDIPSEASD